MSRRPTLRTLDDESRADDDVKILAVIPARYSAARLPGKPLADLAGRPLVQWVYEAATSYAGFDEVVVATDTDEIASRVRAFGGAVELTRHDHASGTDRVAEVAARRSDANIVVNVQGDLPFATDALFHALLGPYLDGERPPMTTLASPLTDAARWLDPDTVKVVRGFDGYALYFSRSPIPFAATDLDSSIAPLHHIGLYAFARDALLRFTRLSPTRLERQERLEQLRALEHGMRIKVCETTDPVFEVNTSGDLERARKLVEQ